MVAEQTTGASSAIPTVYTKKEVQALLKVSASTVNKQLREGKLRHFKVGTRVLIPAEAVAELLKAGEK